MDLVRDPWLYEKAVGALHALVPGEPKDGSPFHLSSAPRLGILGVRPTTRTIGGAPSAVLIVSVDADRYPDANAPDLDPRIPEELREAGVPAFVADVPVRIERIASMGRIPPAQGHGQTAAGVRGLIAHPGSPLATIVSPRSEPPGQRQLTVGGTLGGVVRCTSDAGSYRAVVSCSHCIAETDRRSPPPPARGYWVLPAGPWDPRFRVDDPAPHAVATLDRWRSLEDPIDVAAAELCANADVLEHPNDPYSWPVRHDAAVHGEPVWFHGAGTRKRACGVVESTRAIAYVTNADGSPTWYRSLVAVGRWTAEGWRPVTLGGDSGAWGLAWRGGHVACVGMFGLVGRPWAAARSHAFSLAFPMTSVLDAIGEARRGSGATWGRVSVAVDPGRDRRGLPPPPWLAECAGLGSPVPKPEVSMSKDGCIVYNFHFHATAQCGQALPDPNEIHDTARTGFSYFTKFRITAGDTANGGPRKIKAVRLVKSATDKPSMPNVSPTNPILPGRAALWEVGSYWIPAQTIEVEVEHERVQPPLTPLAHSIKVTAPPGTIITELDIELRTDASGDVYWSTHFVYKDGQAWHRTVNAGITVTPM